MSAPTPAPGDDRPREGFYPDPSIPGYVRYWNGASWVPGTSRPAPRDGESLAPPPGAGAAPAASVEETGPHFFDEDPVDGPSPADAQHGSRPEPASAWGADRARQSGFGGEQDRRVSWGAPQGGTPQGAAARPGADPRVARADGGSAGDATAPADGTASAADRNAAGDGTFVFRRPAAEPGAPSAAGAPDDGTMTFRAVGPRAAGSAAPAPGTPSGGQSPSTPPGGAPSGPAFRGQAGSSPAPAFGGAPGGSAAPGGAVSGPAFGGQGGAAASGGPVGGVGSGAPGQGGSSSASAFGGVAGGSAAPGGAVSGPAFGGQGGAAASGDHAGAAGGGGAGNGPGFAAGKAAAARAAAAQAGAAAPAPTALSGPQASPTVPPQSAGPGGSTPPAAAPLSPGPGGGQSSWAQQVHRLAGGAAGDEQPVAPWKPPVEDVFQAAARRQASARPAGLGKRLAARLLDTVVLAALTAVAAVPLGTRAVDHVTGKIDAARLSGETVTVWLLDGTTSVYLGIVLAVLLLAGVVCEVLPTAKWGRTLGKRLMGLEVRDIEGHEPPAFGAALRRWLVYSVPGLLGIGIVGVAWCLFDRPWHQCWHDKAAHTFVAG
ncbi:RDD family protein [Streptomyces sp. NPDC017943]|uniref:RDD family protein n=1 Tax=Streptomyces sp. NPDC017943 TaxID=3365019 RepID=UPI0037A4844B